MNTTDRKRAPLSGNSLIFNSLSSISLISLGDIISKINNDLKNKTKQNAVPVV